MSGRRLTQYDMNAARHEMDVYNSLLKRGEIKDADKILSLRHIVCGCGVKGCIFIHAQRKQ